MISVARWPQIGQVIVESSCIHRPQKSFSSKGSMWLHSGHQERGVAAVLLGAELLADLSDIGELSAKDEELAALDFGVALEASRPPDTSIEFRPDAIEQGLEFVEIGSCPSKWCSSGRSRSRDSGSSRLDQAATAGRLTIGSSLKAAIVSRVM
ncbi:hypothetical protein [Methylosinus sp. Sm6]|uniref:hypothetical protein n=1 Tax=Methylosinus sp. Sm6 TaxID=2866948 RepID=UPI001C997F22|nr:hypothetical protein [Methylosinus sp. Sm6]